jgi:mscS mechanosensitive ion channel
MVEYFTLKNGLILIFFVVIYIVATKGMAKVVQKHNNLTNTFLANASKTAIIVIGMITLLSQYDSFRDVFKSLLTNSAILVAVVGFTLQNSIKNVIAGTLLLSADTFKVGDRIRIPKEDISGEIEELTLRHAKIKLVTSERAIVPNYLLNDAVVINNNLYNEETCYPLIVPVSTTKDIRLAKKLVEEIIENHEDVIKKDDSNTIVTTLQPNVVEIHTLVWTNNLQDSFRVLSELRIQVLESFQENGIYER